MGKLPLNRFLDAWRSGCYTALLLAYCVCRALPYVVHWLVVVTEWRMKVLVSDELAERGISVFRSTPGIEVDVRTDLTPSALLEAIGEYDGLVVRSRTKVTAELLGRASNLRVVGRAGVGVDNVDVDAATERGIVVMNTPEANTITTAEHTFAMMLALARRIPQASVSAKAGRWERDAFLGSELYNKVLGIIGLGRIGMAVAERGKGFGMKVLAQDPFISYVKASEMGVELVELDELLRQADFVTVHTPLLPETEGLLGEAAFAKMKEGAYVINCARGGIVDEGALAAAIESGRIAGAALDVFVHEPPGDHPLLRLDSVITTPHLGASTKEAQESVSVAIAEQMRDFLLHGVVRNAVNMPSVAKELLPRLMPYLRLAEGLGRILGQLVVGGVTQIDMEFSGDITSLPLEPISVAAIRGILSSRVKDVNMVNAPSIAKGRGIEITEKQSKRAAIFASLVTVTVTTDVQQRQARGTIFHRESPRLVGVDEHEFEAEMGEFMLFVLNDDVPGVIGKVGTILGANQINIAGMSLGRNRPQGTAASVYNVDSEIPAPVLDELNAFPYIREAKLVKTSI